MARRKNRKLGFQVGADISDAQRKLGMVAETIDKLGKKFDRFGASLTRTFSTPLSAIGAIATKSSLSVDDAFDSIAANTGATGESLKRLQGTFAEVAKSVPDDLGIVATAVGDLNTRLGLTGETLKTVSQKALDAARLAQEDVTSVITESSKAMKDWGLEASEAVPFMDKLFKSSQLTGISMANLGRALYQYGSPLRQLGFDIDTTTALIAKFEHEGVNMELVLGSMRQALARMAKAGVTDAKQALEKAIETIKKAGSVGEANAKAIEVFGSRAGPDLAAAIREGRFEVSEMVKTLQSANGAIADAIVETDGFIERIGRIKNRLALSFAPIGDELLGMVETGLEPAVSIIEKVNSKIGATAIGIGLFVAALGPAIWAIGKWAGSLALLTGALTGIPSVLRNIAREFTAGAGLVPGYTSLVSRLGRAFTTFQVVPGVLAKVKMGLIALGVTPGGLVLTAAASLLALGMAIDDAFERAKRGIGDVTKLLKSNPTLFSGRFFGGDLQANGGLKAAAEQQERIQAAIRAKNNEKNYEQLEAQRLANLRKNVNKPASGQPGGAGNGSASGGVESLVERIRDRIKYLKEDGKSFLPILDSWAAKLKPLSKEWKAIADLQKEIREDLARKAGADTADAVRAVLAKTGGVDPIRLSKEVVEAQEIAQDAQAGSERFYETLQEAFSLGLMSAKEYFDITSQGFQELRNDLVNLGVDASSYFDWPENMRERFAELQGAVSSLVGPSLEVLNTALQEGNINAEQYITRITELIGQFADLGGIAPSLIDGVLANLKQQWQDGEIATNQYIAALERLKSILGSMPGIVQKIETSQEQAKQTSSDLFGGIIEGANLSARALAEGFASAAVQGRSFMDVLRQIGQQLLQSILTKMLTPLFGALLPFASGGIVTGPTPALIGEAGPEAVIPLANGAVPVRIQTPQAAESARDITVVCALDYQLIEGIATETLSKRQDLVVAHFNRDYMENGVTRKTFRRR